MIVRYYVRQISSEGLCRHSEAFERLLLESGGGYDRDDLFALNVVFAVHADDKLVGFGGLASYHGFWCLRLAVVAKAHRGNGLQRKLIRARVQWLKRKKEPHVNAWVCPENFISLNNLIDEGFRFCNADPREFHGKPHVKLRKMLA